MGKKVRRIKPGAFGIGEGTPGSRRREGDFPPPTRPGSPASAGSAPRSRRERALPDLLPPDPPPPVPPAPPAGHGSYQTRAAAPPGHQPEMPVTKDDVIVVDHVSKWYGQVLGLSDVSIRVRRGITGLLGPNGAGKSTLLKIITGQIEPVKGAVTINGMTVWGNPDIWLKMGYCPEQDAFWEWMSGRRFIFTLARMQGMSVERAEAETDRVLDMVDMQKAADRRIGGYSRGMRQRVKIAQTLVHDPDILIYDEPLSGTDPLGRIAIIDIIHDLEAQGKTILVSSHVLAEVERITDNVLLINRGRLLAEGRVDELRDLIDKHPHRIFIATEQVEELACLLARKKWIWSVRKQGKPPGVHVETHKADEFFSLISGELVGSGITITEMTSQDDNLDAVFKYLVG